MELTPVLASPIRDLQIAGLSKTSSCDVKEAEPHNLQNRLASIFTALCEVGDCFNFRRRLFAGRNDEKGVHRMASKALKLLWMDGWVNNTCGHQGCQYLMLGRNTRCPMAIMMLPDP